MDSQTMNEKLNKFLENMENIRSSRSFEDLSNKRYEIRQYLREELDAQIKKKNNPLKYKNFLRIIFIYSFNEWEKKPNDFQEIENLISDNDKTAIKNKIKLIRLNYVS